MRQSPTGQPGKDDYSLETCGGILGCVKSTDHTGKRDLVSERTWAGEAGISHPGQGEVRNHKGPWGCSRLTGKPGQKEEDTVGAAETPDCFQKAGEP